MISVQAQSIAKRIKTTEYRLDHPKTYTKEDVAKARRAELIEGIKLPGVYQTMSAHSTNQHTNDSPEIIDLFKSLGNAFYTDKKNKHLSNKYKEEYSKLYPNSFKIRKKICAQIKKVAK